MSLIYRAMWQDEPDGVHDRGLDAFTWWVRRRHPGEWTFTVGEAETFGDAAALVRSGTGDAGSIQRCTLHVDDGVERFSTTLITLHPTGGVASVWVDRERVSRRSFASFTVQAPALSTRLIHDGVRPRRGPVDLRVTPMPLRADAVPRFVRLLGDPARDLPILLLAAGPDFDVAAWHAPATRAAQVLAGSVAVYVVGPVGRVNLNEILGADLAVDPGGARLYLPGVSPDEPLPTRHRHLEPERVRRDPDAVPHTIIQLLAPSIAARRAPVEYPELRRLLDADADALLAERDELVVRTHDLEAQLALADDQILELVDDLTDAEGRINLLQAALAAVDHRTPRTVADDRSAPPPDVDGLVAAARAAQTTLRGIVLPDEACHDLELLDRTIEAGVWGRTAWRGLLALDAFATDRDFQPGFWQWCSANRSPYAWPATQKKLAMRESETVMANESLRRKRLMPVERAVDPSGRIEMQAHLKIAEGGNHQIPRIYFHDDRHGATGRVHIGFFGPHRHVPNTLT